MSFCPSFSYNFVIHYFSVVLSIDQLQGNQKNNLKESIAFRMGTKYSHRHKPKPGQQKIALYLYTQPSQNSQNPKILFCIANLDCVYSMTSTYLQISSFCPCIGISLSHSNAEYFRKDTVFWSVSFTIVFLLCGNPMHSYGSHLYFSCTLKPASVSLIDTRTTPLNFWIPLYQTL